MEQVLYTGFIYARLLFQTKEKNIDGMEKRIKNEINKKRLPFMKFLITPKTVFSHYEMLPEKQKLLFFSRLHTITLVEAIDTSCCIYQFLLTCVEWVAC